MINKRRALWRALFPIVTLICLLSVSTAVFGLQTFKVDQYVTDKAGVLDENQRNYLSQKLNEFAEQTGNQVLVVTIPSLEEDDLVDYSERLFELNKPGQKGKDNGLILLVSMAERKIRIEVGYGLEETVPDGRAGTIIRDVIAPYFKSGDYNGGITAGVAALLGSINPDYQNFLSDSGISEPAPAKSDKGNSPGRFLVFAIILILIMVFNGGNTNHRRRRRGFSEPYLWGGGSGFGGSGFGGGGSSGGGFSSGGGSFGGGGSSGGW